METVTEKVWVTATMSNLPPSLGFKDAIKIELHEVIKEFIEDVTGSTQVASRPTPASRLLLMPPSFFPDKLCRLLRRQLNREPRFCQYVAEQIACCRFSRGNCTLYQKPFLMSVKVRVVKEVRFIMSSVPSSGASVDVFRRLIDEQTVEPVDLDETCSICFEKLSDTSSSESHQNSIIQMPKCLHPFHQNCIFEWLARHNSCPLCRRVPYEEDDQD